MTYRNTEGEEIPAARGLAKPLVGLVRFYQRYGSPMKMASSCRFEPTCSAYALEALSHYGAIKGSVYAVIRLLKCGPWHPGGYDPVTPSV